MEPTPTQPTNGYPGSASPAFSTSSAGTEGQFSTTAAHATGDGKYPADYSTAPNPPAASGLQGTLNTALASGKKWLDDSGLADKAQQLPQTAKELSNKALTSVKGLTNTQKAVGVGLLAAGIAFLATRGKNRKNDEGEYRPKARRSPFDKKPYGAADDRGPRAQQRPWGSSRYGSAAAPASAGRSRVSVGSGPKHEHPDHQRDHGQRPTPPAPGQRRDQGPASGSHYDAKSSGGQNPNNAA